MGGASRGPQADRSRRAWCSLLFNWWLFVEMRAATCHVCLTSPGELPTIVNTNVTAVHPSLSLTGLVGRTCSLTCALCFPISPHFHSGQQEGPRPEHGLLHRRCAHSHSYGLLEQQGVPLPLV